MSAVQTPAGSDSGNALKKSSMKEHASKTQLVISTRDHDQSDAKLDKTVVTAVDKLDASFDSEVS